MPISQTTATNRSKKVYKLRKSPLEQEREKQAKAQMQAAKEAEKARKAAVKQAREDAEKEAKIIEVFWLMEAKPPAPLPYTLRLPSLPARQNITGRNLPIKVFVRDNTFPQTDAARNGFVTDLLNSMRDVREAKDTISITTDYRYVWLKPALEQKFSYSELDMERVCRKLVYIAEGLHAHGLGATEIYCPRTIQKARKANALSFQDRIDMVAELMRRSKARCDSFMLGNTMEVTVALIEEKLTAHKSNCENNKNRSLKLQYTNWLQGLKKGEAWPRDANGKPIPPAVPSYSTPESIAFDGTDDSQHNIGENFGVAQTLAFDNQVESFAQGFAHGDEYLQQYTYAPEPPLPTPYLAPPPLFDNGFGGAPLTGQLPVFAPSQLITPFFEMHPGAFRYLNDLEASRANTSFDEEYAHSYGLPVHGPFSALPSSIDSFERGEAGVTDFVEGRLPSPNAGGIPVSTLMQQAHSAVGAIGDAEELEVEQPSKRRRHESSSEQADKSTIERSEQSSMNSVVRGRTAKASTKCGKKVRS